MQKEEKKRTFESESLILPALKMILVETEKNTNKRAAGTVLESTKKEFTQEIVMRIIGKLSMKE